MGAGGVAHLADVTLVDLAPARAPLAGVELVVACDVDSPLVGPRGAARVFGPQKGLGHDELAPVDDALAALAARFEPGIEVVTRLTGLAAAVARAGPLLEALAHRLVPHAHAPVPSRAEPAPGRG